MSTDLCDLFNKYGSDKDRNGYAQVYHTLFNVKRDEPITLLEIGIGTMIPGVHSSMVGYALEGYKPGGSLRAWRDFFPNGRIIGADVQPDTQFDDEPRIETYLADSTKSEATAELYKKMSKGDDNLKFDIIIDDGSHYDVNQFATLKNLYPYVKEGGIYVIEDIYPGSKVSTSPAEVGKLCNGDPYFFVGVKNNICIVYKNRINTKRENY
jgi:8-demethyl-8-alpha-L-rhamnosyltetracenomycin-C 2'-O-methyltransferase